MKAARQPSLEEKTLYPKLKVISSKPDLHDFLALSNGWPSLEQKNSSPNLNEEPPKKRSPWMLALSLIIATVLFYLSLQGLDWEIFWNTIKVGHYEFILLIIPISSFNFFVRALRWSIFVRAEKKVSISAIFWANMVGYLGNSYLPARAGELLRSAFLGQKSGLGTSFILATALTERILDVVTLVLIGSVSLLWQEGNNISPTLTNAIRIVAAAGIAGLTVIIAAPFQEKLIIRFITWLPLPPKITTLISEQTARFLVGMRSLQNWRRLMTFFLLTGVIWFVDAFTTTIVVQIISQNLSIEQALILLCALGLSSAIPSTPGNIGVYPFVAITVLAPIGFSRAEALAYIIIGQVLNYVVISFWGLIGLWEFSKNKKLPSNTVTVIHIVKALSMAAAKFLFRV